MEEKVVSNLPILTIGIITYNRSSYLRKILDSIPRNDSDFMSNVEIIVLDNGSTDDTSIQLDKYRNLFELKVIKQEENIRGAETFKRIIKSASGKFMIIPGDDDCFYNENLNKLIVALKNTEPDVNLLTCFADVIDERDRLLAVTYRPEAKINQEHILAKLIYQSFFWLPATVFRRETLAEIDLSPSLIALDWSFWIEAMTKGRYMVLDTPIIKYRQHSNREQESFLQLTWDLDSFLMLENSITCGSLKAWFDKAGRTSLDLFAQELANQTKNRNFNNLEIGIYLLICKALNSKINIRPLLLNLYENPQISFDPRFTQTLLGINLSLQEIDSIFNSIGAVFSYSGNNYRKHKNLHYFNLVELNGFYSYEWKVGSKTNQKISMGLSEVTNECLEVYNLIQKENRSLELKATITPFEATIITFLRQIRRIKYGHHWRKLKLDRFK
jgi:glycosyltransferase involved in cell wall biosynthesis